MGVLATTIYASEARFAYTIPGYGLTTELRAIRRCDRRAQRQVAAHAGFSDQSQFSHHFKRLIGVTPGRFLMSARIA
jgi:AraC-like DNA-binding protein